ncbi:glycerophosphodiester phosphodiesterase family protein [Sporolactobacillus sp. THM7-7]|nr:glycerophosphodiester phosphodiesterase family protein [Sporolactobacillus sp. THM7-7]
MRDQNSQVYWQAHRGGGLSEAPDNTMAANGSTWRLGGIPEADIRTTRDGVIVCLHDETPARTTNAPNQIKDLPIHSFTFEEIRSWDAGVKFDKTFQGEKIPALKEVFSEMQGRSERMIYLDLKKVDLDDLGRLIDRFKINKQVIFTHNVQENCRRMKEIAAGVKSMLWIGGGPDQIRDKFSKVLKSEFSGLDQVQIHLKTATLAGKWAYEMDRAFLRYALEETSANGIDLEVFPFSFDTLSIHRLLNMGIRWFATDEPSRFIAAVHEWEGSTEE